jgi:hypothetical protein
MQTAIELKYKPDFEQARTYWDAFWMHEMIDRPCTVIWAKKQAKVVESQRLQPVEQDFQKTFEVFDRHLETYEFMGDNIPGFRPGFGSDQVAAFLGAPLLVSPDSPDIRCIAVQLAGRRTGLARLAGKKQLIHHMVT